jgi:hypothetical protein
MDERTTQAQLDAMQEAWPRSAAWMSASTCQDCGGVVDTYEWSHGARRCTRCQVTRRETVQTALAAREAQRTEQLGLERGPIRSLWRINLMLGSAAGVAISAVVATIVTVWLLSVLVLVAHHVGHPW